MSSIVVRSVHVHGVAALLQRYRRVHHEALSAADPQVGMHERYPHRSLIAAVSLRSSSVAAP